MHIEKNQSNMKNKQDQLFSDFTRKTWNSLSPQTHSIQNGRPVSFPKTSAPSRTLEILQSRLKSIRNAVDKKK